MGALSIRTAAKSSPDQTCWVWSKNHWSYGAVASLVEKLSRGLDPVLKFSAMERYGDRASDLDKIPVALTGERSLEQILAIYLLCERRIPFVVLHPRWSDWQSEEVLARCGVEVVLSSSLVAEAIGGSISDLVDATALDSSKGPHLAESPRGHREGERALQSSTPDAGDPTRSEETEREDRQEAQVVLFTSGTEGNPKGVRLSRCALVSACHASTQRLGWSSSDRWLLSLPIAHVGGLSIVLRGLCARGTIVVDQSTSFEPSDFVRQVSDSAVTMVSLVPTMLQRIVDAELRAPTGVRFVLVGGARAPEPVLGDAEELGWRCLTTYGMTEAGSQVATQAPAVRNLASKKLEPSVGKVLTGTEVRICNPDEAGIGSIEVRGSTMFSGYLGEKTRGKDDWFRTGDRGRLDSTSGELFVYERTDSLIISGGENVSPAKVETILESHPDIEAACVIGLADREWGQTVAAVVEREQGLEGEVDGLDDFLRPRLSGYERPRAIKVVRSLPLTAGGKVDREACTQLFAKQ